MSTNPKTRKTRTSAHGKAAAAITAVADERPGGPIEAGKLGADAPSTVAAPPTASVLDVQSEPAEPKVPFAVGQLRRHRVGATR